MSGEPTRFRFGPLERRGLVAGWRAGQIGSVAGGLVVAVLALRSHPTPWGAAVALAAVLGAVVLACWPVRGRTGEEWLPTVARFLRAGGAGRRHRTAAPGAGRCAGCLPLAPGPERNGARPPEAAGRCRVPDRGEPPGPFRGLRVSDAVRQATAPSGNVVDAEPFGVVEDRRRRTLTAVLALRGHTFALLGAEDRERRVAGWSALLAACAREGSVVQRLQWVAATLPDAGRGVRRHLEDHAVLPRDSSPFRSYEDLLDVADGRRSRHEVFLAVQVRGPGARGGRRGADGHDALRREADNLRRLAGEAGVSVDGALSASALSRLFARVGQDAATAARSDGGGADGGGRAPACSSPCASSGRAWPMAVEPGWDRVRA